MGCNDITKFDYISGSHVVGKVYMYCNEKMIACRLPDNDILTNLSH